MMPGIDPARVKVGDVVQAAWDMDPDSESCHCAFRVEVGAPATGPAEHDPVRVISHDLKPGDIVRVIEEREDEGVCHCDFYFMVERG